jgi:23S rRNA pseudouridine1911/1915/1917 synthase
VTASHQLIIDDRTAGIRLDLFVTRNFIGSQMNGLTRSAIQKLIGGGQITINGQKSKPSVRLKINDLVRIQTSEPRKIGLEPEALPLRIIYEDQDFIVVNKAPGMVVHPAAGSSHGTLVNALLYHCSDLQGIGGEYRPGIVHRLDKDTSGAMIVAKNDFAFHQLAQQFKNRTVEKEYVALVWGMLASEKGMIDRPIGRHRSDRKRMSSIYPLAKAREALTEWKVQRIYRVECEAQRESWLSWLQVKPRTGRTHQIRVHLADLGHPVVGDRVYGLKKGCGNRSDNCGPHRFSRQALHAQTIAFRHPRSGAPVKFVAPLAEDICNLLKELDPIGG